MFSRLVPTFVYTDVSSDITEHDLDVVADTWDIDGRDVYRGTRDSRYTHASVFWLYDDNLERVGCMEHSLEDHADVRALWFQESEFGTLLQEEWTVGDDLWSSLPRHVFDRFLNEGWTTPRAILDHCLNGSVRVISPDMLTTLPVVYTCSTCGRKSLTQAPSCTATAAVLDVPEREKVFFVDSDCIVHIPPPDSRVWSMLQPQHDDDSSQEQMEPLECPPQTEPKPPLAEPLAPPPEQE